MKKQKFMVLLALMMTLCGCSSTSTLPVAVHTESVVDVHSNIFEEYLSSVTAKLPKENKDYKALQDQIESLCQQYPKVFRRI